MAGGVWAVAPDLRVTRRLRSVGRNGGFVSDGERVRSRAVEFEILVNHNDPTPYIFVQVLILKGDKVV